MGNIAKNNHERPANVSDEAVKAAGKVSEALEWIERARGRLYDFHQMTGHADLILGEAADELEEAGQGELAEKIRQNCVGRNVLYGRWTFQVVEEFDEGYYSELKRHEKLVRAELLGGKRHVYEAEMKQRRRTKNRSGHEPAPGKE